MSASTSVKNTVLVFMIDRARKHILLIEKKRGMGKGLWNGPGGKLQPGESVLEAVCREAEEECGLTPLAPERMGVITFLFEEQNDGVEFSNRCEIFRSFSWSGQLVGECDECRAFWWPMDQINFDLFWPDDRYWLPLLIEGKSFERIYHFDKKGQILRETILDGQVKPN